MYQALIKAIGEKTTACKRRLCSLNRAREETTGLKRGKGGIPDTELYTPDVDGLFRISGYAVVTQADTSGANIFLSFVWHDDAQEQAGPALSPPVNVPLGALGLFTSGTAVIQQQGGMPIKFGMHPAGTPGGAKYSLYITVEQLM